MAASDCPTCGLPRKIIRVHRKLKDRIDDQKFQMDGYREQIKELRRQLRAAARDREKVEARCSRLEKMLDQARFSRVEAEDKAAAWKSSHSEIRSKLKVAERRAEAMAAKSSDDQEVLAAARILLCPKTKARSKKERT